MAKRRSILPWLLGAAGVLVVLAVLAVVFAGDNIRRRFASDAVDHASNGLPCATSPAGRKAWVDAGLEAARDAFPGLGVAVRDRGCGWDGGRSPRHVFVVVGPLAPPDSRVDLYLAATVSLVGPASEPIASIAPWPGTRPAATFAGTLAGRPDLATLLGAGDVTCVAAAAGKLAQVACRPRKQVTPERLRTTPDLAAGQCRHRGAGRCVAFDVHLDAPPRAPRPPVRLPPAPGAAGAH